MELNANVSLGYQTYHLNEEGINAIKQEVFQGHGVVLALNAAHAGFNNKNRAVYDSSDEGPNHAVAVIGYDDDYPKENFTRTKSDGTAVEEGFYHARETGAPYVFTDAKLLKREEYVRGLKQKLREALDEKEFRLYVQYIFDGKGKVACGAEALSRWDSPEDGVIPPTEYIQMLETAEMIDVLDFYILEECCRTLQEWRQTPKQNLWLSCNMTRITLSDAHFPERFREIVQKYDFDIGKLVIEITEDALAESEKQVMNNIAVCKQMGCRVALDDFGCGYSSLKDLNDYPIDIIKIDRELIIESNKEKGKQLLRGVIQLSHFLGIQALCEGVETEEEMAVSVEAGCDYIQGYLLARTNPADEQSVERGITFL